jgi:hypothetical protein
MADAVYADTRLPDYYREHQAKSYTNAVDYSTGVPRCPGDNETLVNERCVPHKSRFPLLMGDAPEQWQRARPAYFVKHAAASQSDLLLFLVGLAVIGLLCYIAS